MIRTGENQKMPPRKNMLSSKGISAGRKTKLLERVGSSNAVAVQLFQSGLGRLKNLPATTDAQRSSRRLFIAMRRALIIPLALAVLVALALAASAAQADFGLEGFEVGFTDKDGEPEMQAGSHPFAMSTSFEMRTEEIEEPGRQAVRTANLGVA